MHGGWITLSWGRHTSAGRWWKCWRYYVELFIHNAGGHFAISRSL